MDNLRHKFVQTLKGLGFSSVLLIGREALFIIVDVLIWIVEKFRTLLKKKKKREQRLKWRIL